MDNVIQQKLLDVTRNIERQVDSAIEHIDSLDVNDLEELRKNRVKELKALNSKRQEWLQNGHGTYEELPEEKMFFDIIKKSENVIIHFYTNTNERCRIVDKHLKILAPKHLETRIVSFNAEKCPFLAERLRVKTIPTIVCIQNSIMVDKVVGFTTLGNRDDFSTETFEWRLAQNKVLNYEGDLSIPPDEQDKKGMKVKKSIRDGQFSNESDDDLDLEDYSSQFQSMGSVFEVMTKKNATQELTAEEKLELGLDDEEVEDLKK